MGVSHPSQDDVWEMSPRDGGCILQKDVHTEQEGTLTYSQVAQVSSSSEFVFPL